jgi:hypothetical protein
MTTLFLSYATADIEHLGLLREGIEMLHYTLWIDRNLDPGHVWWEDILEQIRNCDAVIVAVSPALVESDAASRERWYARQLGKPVLPVIVAPVKNEVLPADLATIQFVDLISPDQKGGFRLSNALAALPPAPPLPDPLPEPPPAPISYMSSIADAVRAPELSKQDQKVIVSDLRGAMERPKEHDAALELLKEMAQRRDLFAEVDREVIRLITEDEKLNSLKPDSEPGGPFLPPIPEPKPKAAPRARLGLIVAAAAAAIVLIAAFAIFRSAADPTSSPNTVSTSTPTFSPVAPTPSDPATPTETTTSAPSEPLVALDYTEGRQGQVLTLTGIDFIPGEVLTVYDPVTETKVAVDVAGSFQLDLDTSTWPCDYEYKLRIEDALNTVISVKNYTLYC